ncbi:MAG: hypothetical protein ACOC3X_02865 [Nanoarchaeota archaeon]
MQEQKNIYKLEKNMPIKSFKAGAIKATLWENQTNDGSASFNTINLDRVFKAKDGKWQNTHYLRVQDLPKALIVLNKAYEFLVLNSVISPEN